VIRSTLLLLLVLPVHAGTVSESLEAIRVRHGLPALAAAVVRRGRVVAVEAVGVRKAGAPVRATREDQFHIGSCTKAMTATLVGQLVEDGKMSWDTSLADALPGLARDMHSGFRPVTLRQLLLHQGGLHPNLPESKAWPDVTRGATPREQRRCFARAHLTAPPAYPPGTKTVYANAGYAIVGAIIERVLDRPYEQALCEKIFTPLGMTSAGFGAPGTPGETDQPWQHRLDAAGRLCPIAPGPDSDNPDVLAPAGKVHCSMGDWAKFAAQHLPTALSATRLVRQETLRVLHDAPDGQGFALGWIVCERPWGGGKVLTHAGSNTMNYAVAWLAPKRDFAVLVATNLGNGTAPKATDETAAMLIQRYLIHPEGTRNGQ